MQLAKAGLNGSQFAKTCGHESDEAPNKKKRRISLEWRFFDGVVPILD
jgi:hypothetical protein